MATLFQKIEERNGHIVLEKGKKQIVKYIYIILNNAPTVLNERVANECWRRWDKAIGLFKKQNLSNGKKQEGILTVINCKIYIYY